MMQIWNKDNEKWNDCLETKLKTEKENEEMMIFVRMGKINGVK